jgi:hypothetical protein
VRGGSGASHRRGYSRAALQIGREEQDELTRESYEKHDNDVERIDNANHFSSFFLRNHVAFDMPAAIQGFSLEGGRPRFAFGFSVLALSIAAFATLSFGATGLMTSTGALEMLS